MYATLIAMGSSEQDADAMAALHEQKRNEGKSYDYSKMYAWAILFGLSDAAAAKEATKFEQNYYR